MRTLIVALYVASGCVTLFGLTAGVWAQRTPPMSLAPFAGVARESSVRGWWLRHDTVTRLQLAEIVEKIEASDRDGYRNAILSARLVGIGALLTVVASILAVYAK